MNGIGEVRASSACSRMKRSGIRGADSHHLPRIPPLKRLHPGYARCETGRRSGATTRRWHVARMKRSGIRETDSHHLPRIPPLGRLHPGYARCETGRRSGAATRRRHEARMKRSGIRGRIHAIFPDSAAEAAASGLRSLRNGEEKRRSDATMACSPDEAKRNPGVDSLHLPRIPPLKRLHPGYACRILDVASRLRDDEQECGIP